MSSIPSSNSLSGHGTRFLARSGNLRLYNSTLIEDSGEPDPVNWSARELPLEHLPKKR
jgi:hypothetical protein